MSNSAATMQVYQPKSGDKVGRCNACVLFAVLIATARQLLCMLLVVRGAGDLAELGWHVTPISTAAIFTIDPLRP